MGFFDPYVASADAMLQLLQAEMPKRRTGIYKKRGEDIRNDDGTITSGDIAVSVTVWPTELNQQDMARQGVAEDTARFRNWHVRRAVIGDGLAPEDVLALTEPVEEYEVIDAALDPLGLFYTLHTRQS